MDKVKKIYNSIDKVSEKVALVSAFLGLFLMILITYEVFVRYVLDSPTTWSMEITQYLFCGLIALGGSYTLRTEGHVSVDILFNRVNARTQGILNTFGTIIIIAVLALAFQKTLENAMDAFTWHETSGSVFNSVTYPAKFTIPVGIAFFLLQCIARLLKNIVQAITGVEVETGNTKEAND